MLFAIHPDTPSSLTVSLTMPVRLQSWTDRALHPIFQMNLPEGAMLIAIRQAIAKIARTDDLSPADPRWLPDRPQPLHTTG